MLMETIHGYVLDETQWKVEGGNGKCNVATKGGKEYFIKQLLQPKYPESEDFKGEFKKEKIKECNDWLQRRKEIMNALPGDGTGNLVKPIEYFREGPIFYEVAHRVKVETIPFDQIWKESKADKALIMLTVASSLADVHRAGVVHGDLDPGNILISRTLGGKLVTKLIDFTDVFFEKDPPKRIMSKDFWWSPEVALYSSVDNERNAPNPYRKYLSCKADVFSLGIIFHQYCVKGGKGPICTELQPWREIQKGKSPRIASEVEPEFKELIASMLEVEPDSRPSMAEVHKRLKAIRSGDSGSGGGAGGGTDSGPDDRIVAEPDVTSRTVTLGESIPVGKGKRSDGSYVTSASLLSNPKKVKVFFSNGKEQILDLALAIHLEYVKKD